MTGRRRLVLVAAAALVALAVAGVVALPEILQLIGSSGLMATPTERDLAAPGIAPDI